MQAGPGLSQTMMAEVVVQHADMFAPLPVSLASSMTKFTCLGMASQHTPKMAAFRGVRNRLGRVAVGCWGSALAAQSQMYNAP